MRLGKTSFFSPPRQFRLAFIVIALVTATVPGASKYLKWAKAPTFNTVCNARDLTTILSPEAVISGPYAADFTQDNKILNLIHMFGVANVDSAFFERYPITHLIMDKYNAEAAIDQYPQIMKNAAIVCQYFLPKRAILLYRVAGVTGNRAADNYVLSDFEMSNLHYTRNNIDSGNFYMGKHLMKSSDNMSANYLAGVRAYDMGLYEESEFLLRKAIEYAPTDYHLRYRLGEFYITMYKKTKNTELKNKALAEFEKAKKFNPESRQMVKDINELLAVAEEAVNE
jgi:tetratricopeptide (TPR) repeat protein